MKNVKEYFENRRRERDFNRNHTGAAMIDIIKAKTTDDEKQRITANKNNAVLNKPISDLNDIKERFCLSWNELKKIVIKF